MRKMLGLHCLGDWTKYMNHIGLWEPPVITILSPSADQAKEIKRLSPNTIIVGRLYYDDAYYNEQIQKRPLEFAKQMNDKILSQGIKEVDYWQTVNEPTPYWDKLPALKSYTDEWMRLADQSGYKCAILAWSVGNPDLPENDRMVYWRQFQSSLVYAQDNNHVVLVHQYNKPNLINNVELDNWLVFRIEKQVIPNLASLGAPNVKFIIGELGIDNLINNGKLGGFQANMKDDQYFQQLLKWEEVEQSYSENVLGGCIFTLGTQPPWDSYSISSNSNVISLLSTYYASNGEKYDDKVITNLPYIPKEEGNTTVATDLQWDKRLTDRGTKYQLYNPAPNETYLKLIKAEYLDQKEHIFVNVLDQDGKHIYNYNVIIYWNDGQTIVKTEDKSKDQYALADANFGMFNLGCSYNIKFATPSDLVLCEGLGSDTVHDYKIHRSGRYTFQMTKATATVPPVTPPVVVPPVQTYLPYIPNPNTTGISATVSATVLNIRADSNVNSVIIAQLKQGDTVLTTTLENGFYKVGTNAWAFGQYLSFISIPNVPANDNKTITLADFKTYMGRVLDIDPKIVNAILQVESGNTYFNEFGKPVIRTELHLLQKCIPADIFAKYFRILGPNPWQGHEYRINEASPWKKFHGEDSGGGQAEENRVFELTKTLGRACAFESMSMGAPQILGSNYKLLDYNSAEEMYNDFSKSEAAQIAGMFGYIADSGGWAALKKNDLRAFIASYNGPSNVDYYLQQFQKYL